MNPSLFEIGAAIAMVTVSIALVVWFSRDMAAASERRMTRMLAHAGADLEIAGRRDGIMRDVRGRCRRCRCEDLCERWLDRKVDGGNEFCPNAPIFRGLTGRRSAP